MTSDRILAIIHFHMGPLRMEVWMCARNLIVICFLRWNHISQPIDAQPDVRRRLHQVYLAPKPAYAEYIYIYTLFIGIL
jgi:hypothetical protein